MIRSLADGHPGHVDDVKCLGWVNKHEKLHARLVDGSIEIY